VSTAEFNGLYDVAMPFAPECAQLAVLLFGVPQKITLKEALPYRISGHCVSRGTIYLYSKFVLTGRGGGGVAAVWC